MKKLINWRKVKKMAALIWIMILGGLCSLVPSCIFYYIIVPNHWNILIEDDVEVRLSRMWWLFSLVVGLTFKRALDSQSEVRAATRLNDEKTFQKEYFKKISKAIDAAMGMISFYILWIEMRIAYENPSEGAQIIFITFFMMFILRQFTMGMNDPSNSILYHREIPEEWIKNAEKIEADFEESQQKKPTEKNT